MNEIRATNVYYFGHLNDIGGIETFFYELAKKYHDRDIVIVYRSGNGEQIRRLKHYFRCVQYSGQKVICKKVFFNFNLDIIDDVEAEIDYCFVAHGNYEWLKDAPPDHPKLTKWYGVSKDTCEAYERLTGHKCELVYNPLTIEEVKPIVRIVMACRLSDPIKGGERTKEFVKAMDRYAEKHKRQWQLMIFSTPTFVKNKKGKVIKGFEMKSPNVFYAKPRLDIRPYLKDASFVAQFSDNVEGYNYTLNEALMYKTPCILTPCNVYKELGMLDSSIVLNFDLSNLDEVVERIFNETIEVNYTPPKDRWDEIFIDVKSNYKEEEMKNYKVRALFEFDDIEENLLRLKDQEFYVDADRYEYLYKAQAVELVSIDELEEPKIEIEETEFLPKTEETKKEIVKAVKKKTTKKK